MSENTFAVVFSGELVDGANAEQVKANFAQLFKVDIAKVAPMFTGAPVAIKKGIDEATAKKYQQALRQAGALCRVVNMAPAQQAVTATAQPAAGAAAAQSAPPPTRVPTTPAAPTPAAATALATGGFNATLAEPGALLKEPVPFVAAQINTSHLSMGTVGETLVAHETVPELQVDTSGLTMAEVGVELIPPSSFEALVIDVSALSMAEPGTVLQESTEVPVPDIDISKLTMA